MAHTHRCEIETKEFNPSTRVMLGSIDPNQEQKQHKAIAASCGGRLLCVCVRRVSGGYARQNCVFAGCVQVELVV